jgi:hypothetical protein
MSLGT